MASDDVKKLSVLVVDDDRICRTLLQALLTKSSLPVSNMKFAMSLEETMVLLAGEPFDILLLDLNLPDSSGLETLSAIHGKYPALPIIVITGEYGQEIGLKSIANGAQEYLQKGHYNVDILSKSVNFAIERKKAQQEKEAMETQLRYAQKMEAIGTLAGGIAHDFNNMLGTMIGYINLTIQDIEDGTRACKNLKETLVAANRAKDLVKQILTFGREGEEYLSPIRLEPIIKNALNALEPKVPPNIKVNLKITPDCGMTMGNMMNIHRILMNLCTNAIDAMEKNGGTVDISLAEDSFDSEVTIDDVLLKQGQYIRLTVSDTGCGMSDEVRQRMFDPFFTTKEVGKGTGLGLSVVHGILKKCGASIIVTSSLGHGSSFTIYFPKVDGSQKEPSVLSGQVTASDIHILLVDDDKPLLEVTTNTLKRMGYSVVAENNGQRALELFRQSSEHFDLVITDFRMPEINGVKLTKEILCIRNDMPIILLTGFSDEINEEHALSFGFKGYMMKPVTQKDLDNIIRVIFEKKEVKV